MVPQRQQEQDAAEYQNSVNGLAEDFFFYLCLLVAGETAYLMHSLSCLWLGFLEETVQGHSDEVVLHLPLKESQSKA